MSITVDDIVVDEAGASARFTVRLTASSALAISVSYNISALCSAPTSCAMP